MNKRTETKILKLLEKIAEQNQQIIDHLNYKGLGYPFPSKPPFGTPYDSTPIPNPLDPYKEPFTSTPWQPSNVQCPSCKRDTGIPFVLHMVIPPEGLKCPHCGAVAVMGNTTTCQPPYTTTITGTDTTTLRPWGENVCGSNTNTSSGNPNYKVTNRSVNVQNVSNMYGEYYDHFPV